MTKADTVEVSAPSLERTLAILRAFRGENLPRRPAGLVRGLGIPRSSGYQIIRTLLTQGLLERVGRGLVHLGPRFGELLIAYQQQHRTLPFDPAWRGPRLSRAGGDPIAQVPRTFLWNPQLTEMVNCTRLHRPPPYRIGFSNVSTSNPWRMAMLHGMLHCAQRHCGRIARLIVRDAEDDSARQSADIEALVRDKVDLILVSCNQAESIDAALAMAAEARIPVVAVDRRPSRDEHFVTYVSASDIALGRITAQWLAETINGRGTIFMLAGIQGSSPAEQRRAAATEVFSQYPDIVVAGVGYTEWREDIGHASTASLIASHGVPAGVWCDSGLQGAGAMQAFLDLGLPGSGVPPHTGGDVNRVFQLSVRHQIPLAAVEYPAWMGARAVQAALDVLAGKIMPRHIEVHSQVVVSRGYETSSVHSDAFVEDYVRWDRSAEFVASHGLGDGYRPEQFVAESPPSSRAQ